jgi:ATP-binding cassette subfamily B (MDR/TAP) protein 1
MTFTVYFGNRMVGTTSSEISELGVESSTQAENALQNVQVVQAYGVNERLTNAHAAKLLAKASICIRKAVYSAIQLGVVFFVAYTTNALTLFEG